MEVTAEQLQRVNEELRGLPGNKVYAALSNAANRAMMSARGVAWKSVHSMYTVDRAAFYQDTRIHTFRANKQSLSAGISFRLSASTSGATGRMRKDMCGGSRRRC